MELSSKRARVTVCWIERATDGTAAGQHLRGTLVRLRAGSAVQIDAVVADRASADGREGTLRKFARIAGLLLRAMSHARRGRVLVARHHPLLLPAVLWWRLIGGTVVLSVQGSLDDVANEYPGIGATKWLRSFSVACTKRAHVLIAGAPVLMQHIKSEMAHDDTPVIALPNGVFVDELAAAGRAVAPQTDPYVVFVGNLASWQGVDVMVEATEAPDWPTDVELVVVGDGVERSLLDGHERVRALGRLPSSEAAIWYAHSYCAISMKTAVGDVGSHGYWPFKLIESAAVGVPIVCSDARGMREAAERLGNAVVVPDRDSVACASAVRRLFENADLRSTLVERGRISVAEFDWVAGADVLVDAIRLAIRRTERTGSKTDA